MTVLVGVKRSPDSAAAIRLAALEARYRDAPLIAVMAYPAERGWSPAVRPGAIRLTPDDDRAVAEASCARQSATPPATQPGGWSPGSSPTHPDAR